MSAVRDPYIDSSDVRDDILRLVTRPRNSLVMRVSGGLTFKNSLQGRRRVGPTTNLRLRLRRLSSARRKDEQLFAVCVMIKRFDGNVF